MRRCGLLYSSHKIAATMLNRATGNQKVR